MFWDIIHVLPHSQSQIPLPSVRTLSPWQRCRFVTSRWRLQSILQFWFPASWHRRIAHWSRTRTWSPSYKGRQLAPLSPHDGLGQSESPRDAPADLLSRVLSPSSWFWSKRAIARLNVIDGLVQERRNSSALAQYICIYICIMVFFVSEWGTSRTMNKIALIFNHIPTWFIWENVYRFQATHISAMHISVSVIDFQWSGAERKGFHWFDISLFNHGYMNQLWKNIFIHSYHNRNVLKRSALNPWNPCHNARQVL